MKGEKNTQFILLAVLVLILLLDALYGSALVSSLITGLAGIVGLESDGVTSEEVSIKV